MGVVGEALHTAGISADNAGIVEYNSELMARQLGPASLSTHDLSDLALSDHYQHCAAHHLTFHKTD